MRNTKPPLSFWQIWNMCFGFLGIQFGFALQNANVSRIFQTLGADMEQVPGLWIAAPLTGLLVQPVIGYFSDRTWTRLGRRRPYFLWGAIFSTAALLVMPNSPELWIAAGTLWVLDASLNVSMEPFRAFVGDQLAPPQRPTGYAMQGFFIGVGSVIASALPFVLAKFGVANTAGPGEVPDTVRYAFYFGAVVLLAGYRPLWAGLGMVAAAVATGLALYHTGVELHWWAGPSACAGGVADLSTISAADLVSRIRGAQVVRCDEPAWVFLGLSMAAWNALISAGLTVLWGASLARGLSRR